MNGWAKDETFDFSRLNAQQWAVLLDAVNAPQLAHRELLRLEPGYLDRPEPAEPWLPPELWDRAAPFTGPQRLQLEADRSAYAPIPTTWLAHCHNWHEWELAVEWQGRKLEAASRGELLLNEAGDFRPITTPRTDGGAARLAEFYTLVVGEDLQPFQRAYLDAVMTLTPEQVTATRRDYRGVVTARPAPPALPDTDEARGWALEVLQADLGLCLCEDPEPAVVLVARALWVMGEDLSDLTTAHELELAAGSAAAAHLLLGQLVDANLLEHGHHCLGSWLTPKGRRLLAVLAAGDAGAIVDAPRTVPPVCGYCFHPAGTLHADDCALIGAVYS